MSSDASKSLERAKKVYISTSTSRYDLPWLFLLLLFETLLCCAIVRFVPYTEIDWEAYMQEVDLWQAGERDYKKIRGSTGPLVYPAGFLHLYGWLRQMTNNGTDIAQAQRIFILFYVINAAVVLSIYTRVARRVVARQVDAMQQAHVVWSWRVAMGLCCLSKRIHSIFVLRLFNDGPAMLLLYVSMCFFCSSKWRLGCVVFSLAVSIKMNVLLFAPGLLLLLLQFPSSIQETIICLGICASVQLLLGAPFLTTYPKNYIQKAFEFDRVFFYKWTTNWKFLPEDVFVSKALSLALLVLHLSALAFYATRWLQSTRSQTEKCLFLNKTLTPEYIVYTLFVSNFVGICFARTLHYQFYSWYFFSLPFLLWISGAYPIWFRLVVVAVVEYAFNVYPATPTSSALLQMAHLVILVGIQSPQQFGIKIVNDDEKGKKSN